jgi:hypothetical protein
LQPACLHHGEDVEGLSGAGLLCHTSSTGRHKSHSTQLLKV